MSFLTALHTGATGLSAQRLRMNLISSNLANVNTTKTADGGPYRRQDAVFAAQPVEGLAESTAGDGISDKIREVRVAAVITDPRPPITKYDPDHPDADENGYVAMPNINVIEEMVNMISASRSYEANVAAVKATHKMATKALEIGA